MRSKDMQARIITIFIDILKYNVSKLIAELSKQLMKNTTI
jgi:hypothetical protein